MADRVETITEDFHNVRGSFRIAGLVDVGTQASLVRLGDGRLVFLDSYRMSGRVEEEILALTDGGRAVHAILNVHPFHTVFVPWMHARFPDAKLYGTSRHVDLAPDLPWEPERTEDPALHERFADDFEMSVPDGVDFVSANDSVHFSSVLVRHRASGTLHVDDTISFARMPGVVRMIGVSDHFGFHPTLGLALKREAGAAAAFRTWAQDIATRWAETPTVCAAHLGIWRAPEGEPTAFQERVLHALDRVSSTLEAHAGKYG